MVPVSLGQLVTSKAGRDEGTCFIVVGVEQDGSFVRVADGDRRPIAKPKRKNVKHLWKHRRVSTKVQQKLVDGSLNDSFLRDALKELAENDEEVS